MSSLLFAKKNFEFFISALGIFIVVILLWAPFGIKTTDFADGWVMLPLVGRFSVISLFQQNLWSSRPLVLLPWKLADIISSDSFMGVGVVLAALFWGKSFMLYAALRKMRLATPALAFLIAILFMLYPADTGNFMMRALGRHSGVFFYFFALLLLVLAAQQSNPIFLIGMLLTEGISALITEQGYPLMLFTPALLLIIKECSKQKKVVIAGYWYIILFLAVLNFLLAKKSHQAKIFDMGLFADKAQYIKEIILSNLLAYKWVFVDSWLNVYNLLNNFEWRYFFFAIAISCVVGFAVYLLHRFGNNEDDERNTNMRRYFGVTILAGLAVIGLSFFPYSITTFRYIHSRVFYYAAAGAALIVVFIFHLTIQSLPGWKNVVHSIFWGVIVFIISFNGLVQHAGYVSMSQVQQKILVSIVEQAPYIKDEAKIVLLVGENSPFGANTPGLFRSALSWTNGYENVQVIFCDNTNNCLSKINFKMSLLFRYTKEGETILLDDIPIDFQQSGIKKDDYNPYQHIKSYVPFPERVKEMFSYTPAPINVAPQSWKGENQTLNDRRVCNIAVSGNCSLLFYNDGILTGFSQEVNLAGNANQQVELSFWGKAEKPTPEALPLASLVVFYNDGTQDEFNVSGQLFKKWTLQQLRFQTLKPYSSLLLKLQPNTQTSLIWLDDIHLSKDNSEITITNSSFEK